MEAQKVQLAEMIDAWVQDIVRSSHSDDQADERILESMADYRAFAQMREQKPK